MRLGLDIGGTKIEYCLLDKYGKEISKKRIATPNDYPTFVEQLAKIISSCELQFYKIDNIGIGLPGALSPTTGLIKNANCTFLNGKNLKQDLELMLTQTVNIANDANCFALSEAIDGAGKNSPVVFGAILGTGCGGGIVVNKTLIVGPNAICGEWGHNPLPSYNTSTDGEPRSCYCGRKNCIESFISGAGLSLSYELEFDETLSAEEIIVRYRQGDTNARSIYKSFIDQLGRSFSSIINLLDPDMIVLGGGLSNIDELYQDLPTAIKPYVFSDSVTINIHKAKYGDSSGVRGASWLAS